MDDQQQSCGTPVAIALSDLGGAVKPKVQRAFFYPHIRSGALPTHAIGSRNYVLLDDLIALIRSLPARQYKPHKPRRKRATAAPATATPDITTTTEPDHGR